MCPNPGAAGPTCSAHPLLRWTWPGQCQVPQPHGEGSLQKSPSNVNGNSNHPPLHLAFLHFPRLLKRWCESFEPWRKKATSTGMGDVGLEPRPLFIPAWKLCDGAYLKSTPQGDLENAFHGLSQTPSQGPWSHSPCAGGDNFWSREDNALSPTDSWRVKGSPRPFSQVAVFPTAPSDHIAGNTKNLVPSDAKYAGCLPKDTGSTRKACPRHLHNPRKVTWN